MPRAVTRWVMRIHEPADTLVQRLSTGFTVELRICGVSSERWSAVMENWVRSITVACNARWA
jgi:hypothetical protein